MELPCAQGYCHILTGLGLLVKGNCNATAHKNTLYKFVLQTLWQLFEKEPNMDVMIRCPHTSDDIAYLIKKKKHE